MRTVPNQPKTQHRSVRVPDQLWEAAMAKAQAEGTTVAAVINAALQEFVADGSEGDGGEV